MLAVAGMLFMASCGDDSDDPTPTPTVNGPTVLFNPDSTEGFVGGDATLTPGESYRISIIADAGDADMVSYSILRDDIALAAYTDEEISSADKEEFKANFGLTAPAEEGTYAYEFVVEDKDGVTGSRKWTITVEGAATFTSFDNVTLGGQSSSSLGSFYKAGDGTVSFQAGATANPGNVDFFYYVGASNGPTLWSPNDASVIADDIFGTVFASTRNATKIQMSSMVYADATEADVAAATVTGTKAANLEVGDVVMFETVGGVKGLLEVTSIAAGNDGSITFNSKVI